MPRSKNQGEEILKLKEKNKNLLNNLEDKEAHDESKEIPLPSPPPLPEKYNPKDFSIKHQKLVEMIANGYTVTQAARLFEISRVQASRVLNSAKGQEYFAELKSISHEVWKSRAELREDMADKALRLFNEILQDDERDDEIRVKVAKDILGAIGEGTITKHEHKQDNSYKDSVNTLLDRMEEMKKELEVTESLTIEADFKVKEEQD